MPFCRVCVMPGSRPDLFVDTEGVCSACQGVEARTHVDWPARVADFKTLRVWAADEARQRGSQYDCIAAVSGGKDSTLIVHIAVYFGLRVLGVNFEPTAMTPLGQANLDNLQRFCDIVQVKKNREVYRRLQQIGLREVGDPSWPNHAGIFSTVVREAALRAIPLVLWGEAPVAEYGPPDGRTHSDAELDQRWTQEFGGLLGLRLADLAGYGFAQRDLIPYAWPPAGVAPMRSRFLGHYLPWDTVTQAKFVRDEDGFCWGDGPPYTGAFWPFENLDDSTDVAFHDFLALCKYGYTRAAAQLSIEIRHGHRSRADALAIVRTIGDGYPEAEESAFCAALSMPADEVRTICKGYVNPAIWRNDDVRALRRRPECEVR